MTDRLETIGRVPVLVCDAEGGRVAGDRDAVDLIGATYGSDASWVVLPVERLDPDFFVLRSGVAGQVLGKFADYRVGLIVLGDVSAWVAASVPLRDLVRESNRGRQAWFLPDMAEVERRLAPLGAAVGEKEHGRG